MKDALPDEEPHEHRIYASNSDAFALVDPEDYAHFSGWSWNVTKANGKRMPYMRRTVHSGKTSCYTLYLHVAIAELHKLPKESEQHLFVDHIDGNSLNNCKQNLRYVTAIENRKNRALTQRRRRA